MRRNASRFVLRASACHQFADSGAPRHGPSVFDVQPDDLSTAGSCATALARRHRTGSLGRVEVTDRDECRPDFTIHVPSAVLPHRAGHLPKRVVFRTDEVMVLEDPGQPVGDIGTRRTTRVEDAPQLTTSSAYGSHPGLRPGLEHAPIGPGRPSPLLASVEVPTTRCVTRQRCACESRHDFRRACRVTSSDRRPARQPAGGCSSIGLVPALKSLTTKNTPAEVAGCQGLPELLAGEC